MMSLPYTISAQDLIYTVIDDTTITYDACVTGSLIDEATGTPLAMTATITVDRPGIQTIVADGGLFALACYQNLVFPALTTTAYNITLTITAPDYRSRSVTINIPAGSVLPITWPAIALRLLPVRVQGRVVADASRAPIAGAQVSITTAGDLGLRIPANFDHPAGTTVATVTVTPSASTTLAAAIAGGESTEISVVSVAGIAAGQILQIGPAINADFGTVAAVNVSSKEVTLANVINSSFPAGTTVQPVTIAVAGPSTTLARDANAGDGLLLLSGSLAGAAAVEINDGTLSEVHLISALTDADGYYHMNGIGGVKSADFTAQASGFTSLTQPYELSYTDPVNVVNFRLLP